LEGRRVRTEKCSKGIQQDRIGIGLATVDEMGWKRRTNVGQNLFWDYMMGRDKTGHDVHGITAKNDKKDR